MPLATITTHRPVFGPVPESPQEQQWVYQSSRAFQLSATEIGFMTQIRPGGAGTVDLSFGNDLLVVSDLNTFNVDARHVIDRPWTFTDPRSGRLSIASVHWCKGGVVPLGARRKDGSPHPAAGTGFGGSEIVGYPANYATKLAADVFEHWDDYEPTRGIENPMGRKARAVEPHPYRETRLYQLRYDGKRFELTANDPFVLEGFKPAPGHSMWALKHDLPDGDDLLYPMTATRIEDEAQVCGIARWRFRDGAWNVVEFTTIPGAEDSFEPSLERGRDGLLFFTCRAANGRPHARSIRVWMSEDGGTTWRQTIDVPGIRSPSPLTINRSPGGRPFILGNPAASNRGVLAAWPLSAGFDGLQSPLILFDTIREFGLFRGRYDWYVDHPIGSVVRAADGRPRGIVTYRLANRIEVGSDLPPTSFTGTGRCEVQDKGHLLDALIPD